MQDCNLRYMNFIFILQIYLILCSIECINKILPINEHPKCGSQINAVDSSRNDDNASYAHNHIWIVTIAKTRKTVDGSCQGVLISRHHVLSVASCIFINNVKPNTHVVVLGQHDKKFNTRRNQIKPIKEIVSHPEESNDASSNFYLSVIILKLPANLNTYVQPICLPNEEEDKGYVGFKVKALMLNHSQNCKDGVQIPSALKVTELEVFPDNTCAFYNHGYAPSNMICVGEFRGRYQGSAGGIVGGPLIYEDETGRNTVIGLSSLHGKCNASQIRKRKPIYFARVYTMLHWISQIMSQNDFKGPANRVWKEFHRQCNCGKSQVHKNTKSRSIINGTDVWPPNSQPWMVKIKFYGACGGTLIHKKHVLTAGHCQITPLRDSVVLGDHDQFQVEGPERTILIIYAIRHPKYKKQKYNGQKLAPLFDYMVLGLKTEVKFNQYIQPACLDRNIGKTYHHKTGTVTGWGRTDPDEVQKPAILQTVKVVVATDSYCKKNSARVSGSGYNKGAIMCAIERSKDACTGDSGGPLTHEDMNGRHTLIGVISYGVGCARIGNPGYYARVSSVLPWIYCIIDRGPNDSCKKARRNEYSLNRCNGELTLNTIPTKPPTRRVKATTTTTIMTTSMSTRSKRKTTASKKPNTPKVTTTKHTQLVTTTSITIVIEHPKTSVSMFYGTREQSLGIVTTKLNVANRKMQFPYLIYFLIWGLLYSEMYL